MKSATLSSFFALVLCSTVTACAGAPGADADTDDETTSTEDALRASASITPGTFSLYDSPNHASSGTPACEIATTLEIARAPNGAMAKLEDFVEGLCPLAVNPDRRSFKLKLQNGTCGVKIYTGGKRVAGGRRSIKITDYRASTCAVSASQIVLEETLVDGSSKTLYSATPTPPATGTWLTVQPKQCQTNPWDQTTSTSHLPGEPGRVASFLAANQIAIEAVGVLAPPSPAIVCAACSCPRGDLVVVKATTPADATRLEQEFGFAPIDDHAVGVEAKQCNTNPWDPNQQRGTDNDLNAWIKQRGVNVSYAGFAEPTALVVTCQACSCPRGDQAVALATTSSGANKLVSLGWAELP